jgi:eukaryotic-like serine/threonine-protein kinase
MSDSCPTGHRVSVSISRRITSLCEAFTEALSAGSCAVIEDYVRLVPPEGQRLLLARLVAIEIAARRQRGERATREEYERRFPWLSKKDFDDQGTTPDDLLPARTVQSAQEEGGMPHCPHCQQLLPLPDPGAKEVHCPACGGTFRVAGPEFGSTVEYVRQLENFQLLERLGQGTFGTVWKARDSELDRLVAIKIPYENVRSDPRYRERIEREARAAAQLRHPGIAHLNAVRTISGLPVLMYDFIDGPALSTWLKVHQPDARESARIVAEIADALNYAHCQDVIHRDIKPANILMENAARQPSLIGEKDGMEKAGSDDSGASRFPQPTSFSASAEDRPKINQPHPVIVDFGLALRGESEVVMTVEGQILGTLAYMSPEQASGHGHSATNKSDVYCLGVVLYEMLTGKRPFHGPRAALVLQVLRDEPRGPRTINRKIPRNLETVCLKAMNKDPARRYASAGDFGRDLRNFLEDRPIAAKRVGPVERTWRWCKRNPKLATVSGFAAMAVLLFVAVLVIRNFEKDQALYASQRNEATLALDRALSHLEKREGNLGLLWLGRSLEIAPAKATDLERVIRANLAGWLSETHTLLGVLQHSSGEVMDVAISPDGRTVATAAGGMGYLWDLRSGDLRGVLRHDSNLVISVAFSRDAKLVVTAGRDGVAQMWVAANGAPHGGPMRHPKPIMHALFVPNGRQVLTWSEDHTVRIWDADTGKPKGSPLRHDGHFRDVSLSADGKLLLSVTSDAGVRLWNVENQSCLHAWKPSAGYTAGILGPDSNTVLLAGADYGLHLYRVDGTPIWETPGAHQSMIFALSFSRDGKLIATASDDGNARIWDARSGSPRTPPLRHDRLVRSVAFDPAGHLLISGGQDNTARVWDVETGLPVGLPLYHEGWVQAVITSRDVIVTHSRETKVRIWHAHPIQNLKLEFPGKIWAAAFEPDGRHVITSASEPFAPGVVRRWNVETQQTFQTACRHDLPILGMSLSADGRRLATASQDNTVRVWDASTGHPLSPPLRHQNFVVSVAFHPDGQHVLSGSLDGTVRMWEIKSGAETGKALDHPDAVSSVALSPDGNFAVTGCADRRARLWDLSQNSHVQDFPHHGPVTAALFSSGGRLIATASHDKTARIWDAATGTQLVSLPHPDAVQCLSMSPDDQTLVTGCHDGLVRLWDIATGKLYGPPMAHASYLVGSQRMPGRVWTVAFSLDQAKYLSGGDDKTVRLWHVPSPLTEPVNAIIDRIQVFTGMELDAAGAARELDADTWNRKRSSVARQEPSLR